MYLFLKSMEFDMNYWLSLGKCGSIGGRAGNRKQGEFMVLGRALACDVIAV